MLRLISVLLVLLGVAAVGYGTLQFLGEQPTSAPAESLVVADRQPAAEIVPEPRAFEMPAPKPGLDEDVFGVETADGGFLSTLQTVPIAHETPTSARFGQPFEVTVAIDATGDTSAADALPGRGTIVESEAMVSADVQATLSGEMFEIEAVTPVIQTVSPLTENVWRWNVTALEAGTHPLTIELFALNADRAMPVRTFRDDVEVSVSRVGQVIAVANSFSPIAVVLGGIGSLIAGLFGVVRFFAAGK